VRPNLTDAPSLPHRISREPEPDGLDATTAAVRRLMDSLVRHGETGALDLADLTARGHALADDLDADAPPLEQRMVDMWAHEWTSHDPVTGHQNPVAPPMRFTGCADGSVLGEVTLGMVYQGQPGMAHGGISSLLLDHAFGVANGWAGLSGMTAHLELDFKAPTPLLVPLEVRARQVRTEGRKIWVEGSITAAGTLCVSAHALFIAGHLPRPGGGPAPR